jgi:DNA recombination protein RmuC
MDLTQLLLIVLVLAVGFLVYKLTGAPKPADNAGDKLFLDMLENLRKELRDNSLQTRQEVNNQLEKVNDQLSKGMLESNKSLQSQFKQTNDITKEIYTQLTKIDSTNKQVVNFAEQMKSLENILKNPKQRGILGEYFLETLLGNILPPNAYQMQYPMKNSEIIVDAVIFFKELIIPIDSKFSLEKYNRIMEENDTVQREKLEKEFKNDVKKRIDETSKYIRPNDGTTNFAFMFIPAEGIYYNLLIYKQGSIEVNSQNLIEYAFDKHVIIVSPTSFYAYLQTVMQGLKSVELEKNVVEVVKKVGELSRHLNAYQTYMQKLGNNLGTTVNMYNTASKEFTKIDKDVYKITGGESSINVELEQLDKPSQENL